MLEVELKIPLTLLIEATRISRVPTLRTGSPPHTVALKRSRWDACGYLWSSEKCCAMGVLLAVTTRRPASKACRMHESAGCSLGDPSTKTSYSIPELRSASGCGVLPSRLQTTSAAEVSKRRLPVSFWRRKAA